MPRPIEALIHLDAIAHNLACARGRAAGRKVWAVVKANAYGHGLERVLRGLDAADGLALLDLAEAERARAAGWRKPILLLEGVFQPRDLDEASRLQLTVTVHEQRQIDWLAAARPPAPIAVYCKANTGMNRLGFAGAAARRALADLQALPQVQVAAVAMHFANADAPAQYDGAAQASAQWATFNTMFADWRGARSVCNSAALFTQAGITDDWVRPGIALYGGTPVSGTAAASLGLRPAMTLRSRLISVQTVRAGDGVGYGSRWVAPRETRVGIVACGYADGYPRHAPDGTPVAVDGVLVPVAGRVSMDMITVDLSAAPAADVGAAVELWGAQVPIDVVAEKSGTVGYELMCALAPRVPVRVLDGQDTGQPHGQG
jgi:alanine racemase